MTRSQPHDPALALPFEQWIEDARGGSRQVQGLLFEACRPFLLAVAREELTPGLASKVEPADLVQETFLKAHQSFATFQGRTEADLVAWLRRILLNHLTDVARQFQEAEKRRLTREMPLDEAFPGRREPASGRTETPSSQALAREVREALEKALQHLPEHYRQVVQWRNWDRLPFEEIGRRLGRSPDACRKLWLRALEQLQQFLGPASGR